MRKILASFLAAAMVASVGATSAFALKQLPSQVTASTSSGTTPQFSDPTSAKATTTEVIINVDGQDYGFEMSGVELDTTITNDQKDAIVKAVSNVSAADIEINKRFYNLTFGYDDRELRAYLSPNNTIGDDVAKHPIRIKVQAKLATGGSEITVYQTVLTINDNGQGETIDRGTSGDFKDSYEVSKLIVANADGMPIPLTENGVGVDKDQNTEGGAQSGSTVYFMLREDVIPKLNDDTFWKIKVTKGDNGKYIKAVSDVTKNFANNLYDANTGNQVTGTGGQRHRYVKVELNDIYTDDEYKITLDMRISAKSNAVDQGIVDSDDTEIKVNDFYFYMKNIVKNADNDWKVGVGGLMLNPVANDWNDVTYYDEDGDVAHLKFFADSDTSKFFAKLSTKWEHADYASYFNDQDAYIFDFTGSPKLSSTSRADLEIYNPFVDEDGNEKIDPASATIYQVIDGDLFDITDSFEYKEGENGDMAFVTRTRFLGTYIICEKPVEEAADDTTSAPEDLVPEDTAPEAVAPSAPSNGGKAPANTGKYL